MTQKKHLKAPENSISNMNQTYLNELYEQWQRAPDTLESDWRLFFSGFDLAFRGHQKESKTFGQQQSQVASLIYAYRSLGHLGARSNPLEEVTTLWPALAIENFGLNGSNLDHEFDTGHLPGPQRLPLSTIINVLQQTYCGSVGVEYIHIQDRSIRRWLQNQMESQRNQPQFSNEKKKIIAEQLTLAETFESFLQKRYPGQKRFSLEGAESVIPALSALIELAASLGVNEVVLGMAHRGRLNVLANVLQKPLTWLFSEFEDIPLPMLYGGNGDVKYHKGFSTDHTCRNGAKIHVALVANPSHLEVVGPVVEGKARAKQRRYSTDKKRFQVVPVLLHGDAAFSGQGIVAETFNLSQLSGYHTGGTVHLVIDNQIGFTTSPFESRSSRYSTDVAKTVEAPIFHVNGDDPEAVVYVTELALKYRQQFSRDVVIDMLCYRRHGHSEVDEPVFTQPLLYEKIRKRPSVRVAYTRQLVADNVLSTREQQTQVDTISSALQSSLDEVRRAPITTTPALSFTGVWEKLKAPFLHQDVATAVSLNDLEEVMTALTTVPASFQLNPKIKKTIEKWQSIWRDKKCVDWALAELLAFGSLLHDGLGVRLSGQDSARGTFSQRHALWHDTHSNEAYIPLNHIRTQQGRFCVYNSSLSEASVLGFDYGYSLAEPWMLILWEAQFGDFANGAQAIIDQFIVASLSKWERSSGIVMLLPHGYEGQGPEHSNAYLERYLLAAAEDNIQVCNLSSPAQYFHILRRQMKRPFRRPLIIMAPKSLLRHSQCQSPLAELSQGRFLEIIDDHPQPQKVSRVLLCSGKIYYDLIASITEELKAQVSIIRVEQIYPMHQELLGQILKRYTQAQSFVWVQEESQNRGAWLFIEQYFRQNFVEIKLDYCGRPASASPATGSPKRHRQEQHQIVEQALQVM